MNRIVQPELIVMLRHHDLDWLRRNAVWFERLFGLILLGLAGRLVFGTLT